MYISKWQLLRPLASSGSSPPLAIQFNVGVPAKIFGDKICLISQNSIAEWFTYAYTKRVSSITERTKVFGAVRFRSSLG